MNDLPSKSPGLFKSPFAQRNTFKPLNYGVLAYGKAPRQGYHWHMLRWFSEMSVGVWGRLCFYT